MTATKPKTDLPTETLSAVELMAVGRWQGKGCPPEGCDFTQQDIDDMVSAWEATKEQLKAPVKLGHDPKQPLLETDGLPAVGWVTNLRRAGDKLLGDLQAVPKKVADLIKAGAYRARSLEINEDYEVGGETYPRVVTGLALLGATLPAVAGLSDIEKLYHARQLEFAVTDASRFYLFELPSNVSYNDLQEKVRAAAAREFPAVCSEHPWISDLYDAYAIICAGDMGRYWRIAYAVGEGGAVTLSGQPEEVQRATIWQPMPAGMARRLAKWDAAYMNDLPDSAFAYIAPGGEKDDEGKTVPRSLRHLPHHNAEGQVDEPHLRNALSRLPQTDIPAAAKKAALTHLERHARAAGIGEDKEAKKTLERAKEEIMALDEKALRETLGLSETADIVEAVTELKRKAEPGPAPKGEADPAQANLAKELSTTQQRVVTLETQLARGEAEKAVDKVIADGRALPTQRDVLISMALTDRKNFDALIPTLQKVIELGERGGPGSAAMFASLEPSQQEMDIAIKTGAYATKSEARVSLMRQKARETGVELPADFGKEKTAA